MLNKKETEKNTVNVNDLPLYLFHQGTNYTAYEYMGAHFARLNGEKGVIREGLRGGIF